MGLTEPTGELRLSRKSRQRCEEFMSRRLAATCASDATVRAAESLHDLLLDETLAARNEPRRRSPSLSANGDALAYSVTVARGGEPSPFRMLVEPGGLGCTVPEQIKLARRVTSCALSVLGWQEAGPAVEAILADLLPANPAAAAGWWGGIWLGFSAGGATVDFRLYVNLRNGDVASRWRRGERLAAAFGIGDLGEVPFWAAPHAQPAGVCIQISAARVRGFRLYVTLEHPTPALLAQAVPARFRIRSATDFCSEFVRAFGPLGRQTASVAYEFLPRSGLDRVKFELNCELLSAQRQAAVLPWLAAQLSRREIPTRALTSFVEDMETCWVTMAPQYVSVGVRAELEHVTLYCRPAEVA
jgi:hypothetical protein